jgi:hypothetical protein
MRNDADVPYSLQRGPSSHHYSIIH